MFAIAKKEDEHSFIKKASNTIFNFSHSQKILFGTLQT